MPDWAVVALVLGTQLITTILCIAYMRSKGG